MNWKKFFTISTIVTILHYGEDALLLWLGRFTDIKFLILLSFPIIFGLLIGYLSQVKRIRKYLYGN